MGVDDVDMNARSAEAIQALVDARRYAEDRNSTPPNRAQMSLVLRVLDNHCRTIRKLTEVLRDAQP